MKRRLVSVLKGIGIVLLVLAVLYAVLLGISNRRLRQAYAALEADGRPMRLEQIIPAPVADPDNAALVYKAVILQLKAERADGKELFEQLSNLASEIVDDKAGSQALADFRQLSATQAVTRALQALEAGSTKPGCRYDLDYSKGAGILLPHLAELRNVSRILCALARVQAEDGHVQDAWRTVATSLRLAGALKDESILISQLVRLSQFEMAARAVQRVSAAGLPDAGTGAEIVSLLEPFDEGYTRLAASMDMERLALGEWAFRLPLSEFRQLGATEGGTGRIDISALACFLKPAVQLDHAVYLDVLRTMANGAAEPLTAGGAALGQDPLADVPRYCWMSHLLIPAMGKAMSVYTGAMAQSRVTRAGLAVLYYRQEQGRYPADLLALGGKELLDPFSGVSLKYTPAADGFTLYSIGENEVDDGGVKGKDRHSGDLVWQYQDKREPAHP